MNVCCKYVQEKEIGHTEGAVYVNATADDFLNSWISQDPAPPCIWITLKIRIEDGVHIAEKARY